jgi:hypothetical protein
VKGWKEEDGGWCVWVETCYGLDEGGEKWLLGCDSWFGVSEWCVAV